MPDEKKPQERKDVVKVSNYIGLVIGGVLMVISFARGWYIFGGFVLLFFGSAILRRFKTEDQAATKRKEPAEVSRNADDMEYDDDDKSSTSYTEDELSGIFEKFRNEVNDFCAIQDDLLQNEDFCKNFRNTYIMRRKRDDAMSKSLTSVILADVLHAMIRMGHRLTLKHDVDVGILALMLKLENPGMSDGDLLGKLMSDMGHMEMNQRMYFAELVRLSKLQGSFHGLIVPSSIPVQQKGYKLRYLKILERFSEALASVDDAKTLDEQMWLDEVKGLAK